MSLLLAELTPESGSVPSTANEAANENEMVVEDIGDEGERGESAKTVQILQIEPRELPSPTSPPGEPNEKRKRNLIRTNTFDMQSKPSGEAKPTAADERMFEAMSSEFNQTLRSEKIRLQKSIDEQMKSNDVIKIGQNGSVVDSIQSAAQASATKITNGMSTSGYDLTQIKDEHGRTVLHLAAAKEQKRETLYKMLQQAKFIVAERDAKYRTVRDIAVMNGIKANLQTIDKFIIDCFIGEEADYIWMLMIEGYGHLLSVVDSEGNDVISILKKNNIQSMMSVIHELAEFQVRNKIVKCNNNCFVERKIAMNFTPLFEMAMWKE